MLIAFRRIGVPIILLIMVFFSPIVITRPVEAVRAVGPTWDRTYLPVDPGTGSIEQTKDGGFIMSALSRGLWVMKANPAGLPEWQREYSDQNVGRVTQTSDGGFIAIGGNQLLKLDHLGNPEWSKTYHGSNVDYFVSGGQTSDGGYIVAGNTQSFGSPNDADNGWLLRLDSEGRVLWQKVFASTVTSSIEETSDGGFVVAGAVGLSDHAALWVFKLDSLGNIAWEKAYDFPQPLLHARNVVFHEMVHQTSDGHFMVAAERVIQVFPLGYFILSDTNILKLDMDGNIIWQKVYSSGGFVMPFSVSEMTDGGFIVSGRFEQANLGGTLVGLSGPFLLRLDPYGNVVWQKVYGGQNDLLLQARQTRDVGIVAIGWRFSSGFAWAMKLDANGDVRGCHVGVPSNATLTDTDSIVTDTTIVPVDTNATVTSVGVTVTTPTFPVQDQCRALRAKNES